MGASKGVDLAEVIALYKAGRTLKQVAAQLGVNPTTVYYHLRRQDVTLRPTGVRGLRRMPTTQRIEQLRAQGLTWAQVAEQVGMSVDGVKHRIYRSRKRAKRSGGDRREHLLGGVSDRRFVYRYGPSSPATRRAWYITMAGQPLVSAPQVPRWLLDTWTCAPRTVSSLLPSPAWRDCALRATSVLGRHTLYSANLT